MSLVKVLDAYDLQQAFADYGRDYFSLDGYQAILDLFEETDCGHNTDLDVIAICCGFTEADPDDIRSDYSNIESIAEADDDDLIDALNYYTWAQELDNGSIIYLNF